MAYIQPNSIAEFFGDLNLSPNYENTLYFSSVSAKDTYFSNLSKITTVSNVSYIRENRGFIRVERPMSTMYNVTYMRFKNTSFENKWFYAFVKQVNYINNTTTEIEFELDVIMTWMGVFTLNQCFIERQHTLGDAIGSNIADEGFDLGEYVCEGTSSHSGGDYVIMLYKTYNADKDPSTAEPTASLIQGTYIPITSWAFPLDTTNLTALKNLLDDIVTDNREEEILCMKLVPIAWTTIGASVPTATHTVPKPYTYIGSSTYQPRNKKLFTYPFKYLEVENCEGSNTVYKYEYFNTLPDTQSSGNCSFQIMGTADTPEPSVMCTPTGYNGMPYDWDDSISMLNFPSICWNVDAYKAYIAQRDSTIFGNRLASTISGAASGAFTGAIGGALKGGLGGAAIGALSGGIIAGGTSLISANKQVLSDTLNEMNSHAPARVANRTRGNSDSNLMVQSRHKAFYFRMMSITKNYAMMIDDFFDMYGYSIRQHAVPNMNARPNWTYVKTIGCSVGGNIPADDARAIENIFDNGVRFWKNHNNIGNYSLANSPA